MPTTGASTTDPPPDPLPHAEPGSPALSVGDPATMRTRVLSRECATCIFRPGNPMHLAPGQLRAMVADARQAQRFIICHSTLPYGDYPHAEPAVCRGFFDRYQTAALHVIGLLFGFTEVEPPESTPRASVQAQHRPADPSVSPQPRATDPYRTGNSHMPTTIIPPAASTSP